MPQVGNVFPGFLVSVYNIEDPLQDGELISVQVAIKYAEIVVNTVLASGSTAQAFTYKIPETLAGSIALGQLVWVPFGSRRLQGVVLAFSDTSPVAQTKDIAEIVDLRPFLSPAQIDLARWIAQNYLCPLNDAVMLMVPNGVGQAPEILVALAPDAQRTELTGKQAELLEMLSGEGEQKLRAIPRELRASVDSLAKRGIVLKRTLIAPPRVRPKQVKAVRWMSDAPLADFLAHHARSAERFTAIADFLRGQTEPVWISAVYAATGCQLAQLKQLDEAGVIALQEQEVWRDSLAERTFEVVEPPKLTPGQETVWHAILPALKQAPPDGSASRAFLLHGVTGSGKTEIYMRALDEVLQQGRQGIVLVPEISLTPQTIRRFGARFPNRIAILHSGLSDGERYDTWRRCRDGKVDIVIGPRSALFVPLPRLGLVVLDEEHDPAYKQEDFGPHYHAREVALEIARRVGATVILGSATPDVETYYRARNRELTLLELPQRIMGHRGVIESEQEQFGLGEARLAVHPVSPENADARYIDLPPVQIVDLRAELKAGNRSIFSRALQLELARTLAAHQQAILFLNRRGTATFILCRDCGAVFKCRRCDNPMTYHGAGDQLVCHHCNRRDKVPTQCRECRGTRIRYFGTGTEKVETEIQAHFPEARTLRWDWDVTQGKEAHETILDQFIRRQADILIGTQMIAKGLDLPLVTLVGVISADTALYLPDLRSGERTFQLLTQVAGRAGRSILGGKVILQTYAPEHYAIQAASRHDYSGFYEQEIAFRREQRYPPFSRLVRLLYYGSSERAAIDATAEMHHRLATRIAQQGLPALDLIGPAPAFFRRERGAFRYHILVRGPDPLALLDGFPFTNDWRVDVDPVNVL